MFVFAENISWDQFVLYDNKHIHIRLISLKFG